MISMCVPDIFVTHALYPREADHGKNENTHIIIFLRDTLSWDIVKFSNDMGRVICMPKKIVTVLVREIVGDMVFNIVEEFNFDYI